MVKKVDRKELFDKFNLSDVYVKYKHLSFTGGNGEKFLGDTKLAVEELLANAMKNGKIESIQEVGVTKMGNAQFEYIINAGKQVGVKGETLIKIILSEDGGMITASPIKK